MYIMYMAFTDMNIRLCGTSAHFLFFCDDKVQSQEIRTMRFLKNSNINEHYTEAEPTVFLLLIKTE